MHELIITVIATVLFTVAISPISGGLFWVLLFGFLVCLICAIIDSGRNKITVNKNYKSWED